MTEKCAALEAVLFASGDPIEISKLAAVLEITPSEITELAEELADHYQEQGSGLRLLRLEDTLQLATRGEFAGTVRAALEIKRDTPLSNAAMETLTIVAYNQPVTKGFVERVRGVDSGSAVNTLVERGLLEEAGRIDVPGRPLTYRTTAHFLRCFGMRSLADLPPLPENAGQMLFEFAPSPISDSDEPPEEGEVAENPETIEP